MLIRRFHLNKRTWDSTFTRYAVWSTAIEDHPPE